MKTATGLNYETLFFHTVASEGKLNLQLDIPLDVTLDKEWFDVAIPHMKDRIATEKKPGATYEKCIEQIALHTEHLVKAYVKLFETYQYVTLPQTRNGHSAVIDTARADMLASIKDDKMLRAMCALHIGEDAAEDYILPDEREQLIAATVKAMKTTTV